MKITKDYSFNKKQVVMTVRNRNGNGVIRIDRTFRTVFFYENEQDGELLKQAYIYAEKRTINDIDITKVVIDFVNNVSKFLTPKKVDFTFYNNVLISMKSKNVLINEKTTLPKKKIMLDF